MNTQEEVLLDDLITPETLIKENPDKFTKAQLTWLFRNRSTNGLKKSGAVLKVGRRFYLNAPKFTSWLAAQTN